MHVSPYHILAIEKYLTSYLKERNLSIALPRVMEMEEVDTGSPSRFVISNGHVQYIVYYVVYMYVLVFWHELE